MGSFKGFHEKITCKHFCEPKIGVKKLVKLKHESVLHPCFNLTSFLLKFLARKCVYLNLNEKSIHATMWRVSLNEQILGGQPEGIFVKLQKWFLENCKPSNQILNI